MRAPHIMDTGNLLQNIPSALPQEVTDVLVLCKDVKIERIVSKGHCSPPDFWYDQQQNEWVVLIQGEARLRFEQDNRIIPLTAGDYVHIAAHEKHRIEWTIEDRETVWLAVFY